MRADSRARQDLDLRCGGQESRTRLARVLAAMPAGQGADPRSLRKGLQLVVAKEFEVFSDMARSSSATSCSARPWSSERMRPPVWRPSTRMPVNRRCSLLSRCISARYGSAPSLHSLKERHHFIIDMVSARSKLDGPRPPAALLRQDARRSRARSRPRRAPCPGARRTQAMCLAHRSPPWYRTPIARERGGDSESTCPASFVSRGAETTRGSRSKSRLEQSSKWPGMTSRILLGRRTASRDMQPANVRLHAVRAWNGHTARREAARKARRPVSCGFPNRGVSSSEQQPSTRTYRRLCDQRHWSARTSDTSWRHNTLWNIRCREAAHWRRSSGEGVIADALNALPHGPVYLHTVLRSAVRTKLLSAVIWPSAPRSRPRQLGPLLPY